MPLILKLFNQFMSLAMSYYFGNSLDPFSFLLKCCREKNEKSLVSLNCEVEIEAFRLNSSCRALLHAHYFLKRINWVSTYIKFERLLNRSSLLHLIVETVLFRIKYKIAFSEVCKNSDSIPFLFLHQITFETLGTSCSRLDNSRARLLINLRAWNHLCLLEISQLRRLLLDERSGKTARFLFFHDKTILSLH